MPRRLHLAILFLIGVTPFYLNGYYNPLLAGDPAMFWTMELLTWIALPCAIMAYARWRRLVTFEELGFHARVFGRRNGAMLALVIILSVIVSVWFEMRLWDWTQRHIAPPAWPIFHYQEMLPQPGPRTGGWRLLAVLYMFLSAAFIEESYYRGMLRKVFGAGIVGTVLFLIMSSVIFSGAHWEGGSQKLVSTLVVGLFFALIYITTGSLWPAIAGHCAIDIRWFWG